jgi:hypothetical protein
MRLWSAIDDTLVLFSSSTRLSVGIRSNSSEQKNNIDKWSTNGGGEDNFVGDLWSRPEDDLVRILFLDDGIANTLLLRKGREQVRISHRDSVQEICAQIVIHFTPQHYSKHYNML